LLERDLEPLRRRVRAAWNRADTLAAEGRVGEARVLLERAHRLARFDQNLVMALAMIRLRDGDASGAAVLFAGVASRHDVREAWAGLAAASLLAGDAAAALDACDRGLRTHVPDAGLIASAEAALRASPGTLPGWCGLGEDGEILASLPAGQLVAALDGVPLPAPPSRLPAGWGAAGRLQVSAQGRALLGSPVDIQAIRLVEGFVVRTADGIEGWAWHPAAPETDPVLRVIDSAGCEQAPLVAVDLGVETDGDTPFARPRGFRLPIARSGPVRVIGRDGRDLAGSPAANPGKARGRIAPTPKRAPERCGPVDVVVPVYKGLATTLACLHSVLETVSGQSQVWVVNDASPERGLVEALQSMAADGRIRLIGTGPRGEARPNAGFPTAANAGLRAAAGRDVILLNSDTLVAPGWLRTLQQAAHSAADIGTATPLSNEASILSVPDPSGNPPPDRDGTRRMAGRAARANRGRLIDIPTAHGFCMFIRADCLRETGLVREDVFAQGYGEENDFCLRAAARGWRHVAVPSVYVAHAGGVSFGASRRHLLRRNQALLGRLHPGYHASVAAHIEADPLFWARRRLDAEVWRDRAKAGQAHRGAVLLVTHDEGGGTARVVQSRVSMLRAENYRPLLLIGRAGACVLCEPGSDMPTPNLRFALPAEAAALLRLLLLWRPVGVEVHHLLGHPPGLLRLLSRLAIPLDFWVHDYAFLCARVTLTDGEGRFCGEPPPASCERCIAQWGRNDDRSIAPAALRAGAAADFAAARAVIVPSADVSARLRRHMPTVLPTVRPWAAEPAFAGPAANAKSRSRAGLTVAIVGAIGLQKGFPVILACAQDARSRKLNIFFTIVGYTVDDDALEATGHVSITGPFEAEEAGSLIGAQNAAMAFIPSTWPETWCFALTDAWNAGLRTCVFDIGTQAQRVRETGFGWVIPLGLPASRVNDSLLVIGEASASPLPLVAGRTIR
jgi:GT2 family glycosyltransferase